MHIQRFALTDNLKNKLYKMNKDNPESLNILNEQLHSQKVELPAKSRVGNSAGDEEFTCTLIKQEVGKLRCNLKIHSLEQGLKLMRTECNNLKTELQKPKQMHSPLEDSLQKVDIQTEPVK